jgi:hypothetical protein
LAKKSQNSDRLADIKACSIHLIVVAPQRTGGNE